MGLLSAVVSYFTGGSGGGSSGDARTDAGWIRAATIQQLAATAIAILQMKAQSDIYDKQHDIAKGYLSMAKELHDYWANYYKPCEIKTLSESCNEEKHEPDYERYANRFANTARLKSADAERQLKLRSRSCVGHYLSNSRLFAIEQSRSIINASNAGYRYAERRADALNDVRFSRRISVLGMGRNLPAQALSYAQAAANAYTGLANTVSESLGGLGYLFGANLQQPTSRYVPMNPTYSNPSYNTGRMGTTNRYQGSDYYTSSDNTSSWANRVTNPYVISAGGYSEQGTLVTGNAYQITNDPALGG